MRMRILISFVLCQYLLPAISSDEGGEKFEGISKDEHAAIEAQHLMMDSILEDLLRRYDKIKTDDFWHPYDFGTGAESREEIRVKGLSQQHIPGEFIQWKMTRLGLHQHLVGLTKTSIKIFNSELKEILSKDFSSKLSAIEAYTKWDSALSKPSMVLLVATDQPSILVLRLPSEETNSGRVLEEIGSLPLNFPIKSVLVSRVEDTEKVVVVPEDSRLPVTIYNSEMDEKGAQVWFFQRIPEVNVRSVLVHQPDTPNSMLIFATPGNLHIYQYSTEAGQYSTQQTLQLINEQGSSLGGCTEMFAFTLMYQHYITCVMESSDNVHFLSYNYNLNQYEDRKKLKMEVPTSEVFPIDLEGSRDDLILVAKGANGVNLLTFDGNENFQIGHECTMCDSLGKFSKGTEFRFEGADAFVFPSGGSDDGAPVVSVHTEVITRQSPVFNQSKGLYDEFRRLSTKMDEWRTVVTQAEDTLQHRLNPDEDNEISGSWTVSSITAKNVEVEEEANQDLNSENLFNILRFGDAHWTENDFASTEDEITEKMQAIESELGIVKSRLDDALRQNSGTEQVVTSDITLDGLITAENLVASRIETETVNGENIKDILHSLASKQSAVTGVGGGVIFENDLKANRLEAKMVNDIPVDHFAILTEDNQFSCQTSFESIEALGNIQAEKVNGMNLLENVVMANDIRDMHLTDVVAFSKAETNENYPFGNVLVSSLPQTVKSLVKLTTAHARAPLTVTSLNGQDFSSFSDSIVLKDFGGKITGKKTFSGNTNLTTLSIARTWNGLTFPQDFVSVRDRDIELTGRKIFSTVHAKNVRISGAVNGIKTDDLVSLTKQEAIDSAWTFQGPVQILGDISVATTVDGVVMETLRHDGVLTNEGGRTSPNADVIFQGPVRVENLVVNNAINGQNFQDIFQQLIMFDNKEECFVPGTTRIANDAVFKDLEVAGNKVNGAGVNNFLTKNTPQTITNPVTFGGSSELPLSFQEIYAHKFIDGIQVDDVLKKALRVSASVTSQIPWDIKFEEIKCQDSFKVEGPINGMHNYGLQVARTEGVPSQHFDGSPGTQLTLKTPTFTDITTAQLVLDDERTVQNLNVGKWNAARVKLSEPTIFSHSFKINSVDIKDNLDTDNVNGILVEDLEKKVLRSDRDEQVLYGPIRMQKGITVFNGNVTYQKSLTGFMLDDMISHGFPVALNNEKALVLTDSWEFQNVKLTKDLVMSGDVCGVDLDKLNADAVKRTDTDVSVFGNKIFTKPFTVEGNLKTPQLNEKSLGKNIFLLGTDQDISSEAKFAGPVTSKKINVQEINGLSLSWLSQLYSFDEVQREHVLSHNLVKIDDILQMDALGVSGAVQGKDFEQHLQNSWSLSDPNIVFTDMVHLKQPIVVEDAMETDTYNNIDLRKFFTNVVSHKEGTIVVSQPVSFENILKASDGVSVNGNLNADNLPNGLDWGKLLRESIRIDDDINNIILGDAIFEHIIGSGGATTVENLNGREIEKFVTLDTPQEGLGTLRFGTVFMNGSNVDLNGKFGLWDISEEYRDTLMSNSQKAQKVTGSVLIRGPVVVNKNMTCFGENLKNKILLTSDDLVLTGPVEFTSPLVAKNLKMDKPLNGHTIQSIFEKAFSTDAEDQSISELWEFRGPVTLKGNLVGDGIQNQLNIEALIKGKEDQLKEAQKRVAEEKQLFMRKCETFRDIREEMAGFPVKLDSVEIHQVIGMGQEGREIITAGTEDNPALLVQAENCETSLYRWHPSSDRFESSGKVSSTLGRILSWDSVEVNENGGQSVVVVSQESSHCSTHTGLAFFTVSESNLSPVTTISAENVKSFKIAKSSSQILLFTLFEDNSSGVGVFHWKENSRVFEGRGEFHFADISGEMQRIDAIPTEKGFAVMCQTANGVHMYHYSASPEIKLEEEGFHQMIASNSGLLALFQNFDVRYALVPEKSMGSALVHPSCNYKVVRFHNGDVESVQSLTVPEVMSSTQFQFSNQHFLAFLSKSYGLTLYRFTGLTGFQSLSPAPFKVFGDGLSLRAFNVKRNGFELSHPFLFVLYPNKVEIYKGVVIGDKMVGNSDFPNSCNFS